MCTQRSGASSKERSIKMRWVSRRAPRWRAGVFSRGTSPDGPTRAGSGRLGAAPSLAACSGHRAATTLAVRKSLDLIVGHVTRSPVFAWVEHSARAARASLRCPRPSSTRQRPTRARSRKYFRARISVAPQRSVAQQVMDLVRPGRCRDPRHRTPRGAPRLARAREHGSSARCKTLVESGKSAPPDYVKYIRPTLV
jgi:hypothetical protein